MDRNALAELLQALESRRDAEERRREERYTALIERVGLAVAAATTPTTTPLMSPPKARAMKMSAEDDPEAYLVAFERLATAAAWPREFWASQLGPCLIGEAQAAYQAMSDHHATDYDLVKQAILRRLNITTETHRARFREYRRAPETRPRVVAERLCDHMVHWLTPGKKTAQQMGEAIVVEQFCHVVGAETQAWIRRHNPDTLEEAVKLAEDFEDSLTSARIGILSAPALRSSRPLPPSPPTPPPPPPPPTFQGPRPPRAPTPLGPLASPPWRPRLAPSWGRGAAPAPLPYQQRDRFLTYAPSVPPICFRCHQPGHLARSCPAAMECDVAACNWAPETDS
ncbi:protein cappuccino-like [Acipenser ruthenus]|uniref:protein cappuccino-like n=1 Tax=Acipenser ruthenus TaxID=7906 RepID=UPI00274131CC|nr:protein cappuccino-like [Acipenser ruthenus]